MRIKLNLLILRVLSVILQGILIHFRNCKDPKVIDSYINLVEVTLKQINEVDKLERKDNERSNNR